MKRRHRRNSQARLAVVRRTVQGGRTEEHGDRMHSTSPILLLRKDRASRNRVGERWRVVA